MVSGLPLFPPCGCYTNSYASQVKKGILAFREMANLGEKYAVVNDNHRAAY